NTIRQMSYCATDTTTTHIYTLSLHDALPISGPSSRAPLRVRSCLLPPGGLHARRRRPVRPSPRGRRREPRGDPRGDRAGGGGPRDRKSTRLNSSHVKISYAVFCLKKKTHK